VWFRTLTPTLHLQGRARFLQNASTYIPNYTMSLTSKQTVTSKAAYVTQKKARITTIKDEIKFLYKKKDQLNRKLYRMHLEVAQQWGNTWAIIHNNIHENINQGMERKYNTMKHKLSRLEQTQTNTSKHLRTFCLRVVNNTSIQFTGEELNLLNKRLKYMWK